MRIMEIERKVHNIENDPKYRAMKQNLKTLETNPIGSRHVRIGIPENLSSMVELRRNSVEMDDLIERYKTNVDIYQVRIDELNHEKSKLRKELFPI